MNAANTARAYLRFARYLAWEFRWPLGVFATLVLVGGLALQHSYHREPLTYAQACHQIFLMLFLESGIDFPDEWYLQPFFFLLPIVGLGAVADSVVRLAYLVFARKQRLPEWHQMVASLQRGHTVVVGVGKVGYQVIRGLLDLGQAVVAVERGSESSLVDELIDLGVPVIRGDGRNRKTLVQANTAEAAAVVLVTDDDLANLDAALTARELNPEARVALRLFDETLLSKVAGAFAMPGISTALVAAPAFIAAATGRKVYQAFQLAGREVHLTDLTVCAGSGLIGRTVGSIQGDHQINIVMHQGPSGVDVNPDHDVVLSAGDTVLVIAPMARLLSLEAANRPCPPPGRAGGR